MYIIRFFFSLSIPFRHFLPCPSHVRPREAVEAVVRHFTVVGVCELQPVVPLALAVAFVRVEHVGRVVAHLDVTVPISRGFRRSSLLHLTMIMNPGFLFA